MAVINTIGKYNKMKKESRRSFWFSINVPPLIPQLHDEHHAVWIQVSCQKIIVSQKINNKAVTCGLIKKL